MTAVFIYALFWALPATGVAAGIAYAQTGQRPGPALSIAALGLLLVLGLPVAFWTSLEGTLVGLYGLFLAIAATFSLFAATGVTVSLVRQSGRR